MPKTTEQHLIVRSDKSVAYVTNNKRLRSTFCIIEAKLYWQTRNIARPLTNSRAACNNGRHDMTPYAGVFLSRAAKLERNLATGSVSVRPSVRPSHAGNASKWMTDRMIMWFSSSSNLETPVFRDQLHTLVLGNTPRERASNETEVSKNGKNGDFQQKMLYFVTDKRWGYTYNGRLIKSHIRAFEWYQFWLHWMTMNNHNPLPYVA